MWQRRRNEVWSRRMHRTTMSSSELEGEKIMEMRTLYGPYATQPTPARGNLESSGLKVRMCNDSLPKRRRSHQWLRNQSSTHRWPANFTIKPCPRLFILAYIWQLATGLHKIQRTIFKSQPNTIGASLNPDVEHESSRTSCIRCKRCLEWIISCILRVMLVPVPKVA